LPQTAPPLDGSDLPDRLLGTYYDSGEPSVGWHLLAAGDPFCTNVVRTPRSCLKITRLHLGPEAPVDYGPLTVADSELRLILMYDEDGRCLGTLFRVPYERVGENLRLTTSGCLSGAPRDLLVRGEPH
jgi:hypothetical protein